MIQERGGGQQHRVRDLTSLRASKTLISVTSSAAGASSSSAMLNNWFETQNGKTNSTEFWNGSKGKYVKLELLGWIE
jgi:hypothetical protein